MKLRPIMATVTRLPPLACTLVVCGCNTWEGAGKDAERTGEKMRGEG